MSSHSACALPLRSATLPLVRGMRALHPEGDLYLSRTPKGAAQRRGGLESQLTRGGGGDTCR